MNDEETLLRLPEVLARVRLSKATVYRRISAGTFPKPVKAGATALWRLSAVKEWIRCLTEAS